MFRNLLESFIPSLKRNPTAQWKRSIDHVVIDLSNLTLNNIKLNDPLESLNILGESSDFDDDFLTYKNDGIRVTYIQKKQTIEEIEFFFDHTQGTSTFFGEMNCQGMSIDKELFETPQNIETILGSPNEVHTENTATHIAIYIFDNGYRAVFIFIKNKLSTITFDRG
jgi:hypothetical protein